MIRPVSIKLVNFKSFTNQEFLFQKGAFLIQGKNETDEGASSNGSGKSSLREALCYALGLSVFSSTNTDLINNSARSCSVELKLVNDRTNQELTITRTTPDKGSGLLTMTMNGIDMSNRFSTVLEGNKLIIDFIGISKEDLLNYFIISKENFTSFFSSSDTKVKELIGRFSNFNRIDGIENLVQKDLSVLAGQLSALNSENDRYKGRIDVLREQLIAEINVDIESQKNEKIEQLNQSISRYQYQIDNATNAIKSSLERFDSIDNEINTKNAVLSSLEQQINDFKGISFDKEIEDLKTGKIAVLEQKQSNLNDIRELNSNLNEFTKFKYEVENSIAGSIECPKCLHNFVPNSEIDVEEAKQTLPEIVEQIQSLKSSIKKRELTVKEGDELIQEVNQKLSGYEKKISEFNEKKLNLVKERDLLKNQIQSLKNNQDRIHQDNSANNDKIIGYQNSIEASQEQIETIKNEIVVTKEKEIAENITKGEQYIKDKEAEIQVVKDELFAKEQWIFRFKKFRSFLANESLEIIQGYTNMYLQKMKTDLSITLEGFKVLKNGDIREKVTPTIMRNGEVEGSGSFKKYSTGERCKIDLAAVVGLQDLVNNSCKTGGLNILFSDEVTDGLDVTGIENLADSLNDMNKIVLIISHVKHEKVHDNLITVEKRNGISKILN